MHPVEVHVLRDVLVVRCDVEDLREVLLMDATSAILAIEAADEEHGLFGIEVLR